MPGSTLVSSPEINGCADLSAPIRAAVLQPAESFSGLRGPAANAEAPVVNQLAGLGFGPQDKTALSIDSAIQSIAKDDSQYLSIVSEATIFNVFKSLIELDGRLSRMDEACSEAAKLGVRFGLSAFALAQTPASLSHATLVENVPQDASHEFDGLNSREKSLLLADASKNICWNKVHGEAIRKLLEDVLKGEATRPQIAFVRGMLAGIVPTLTLPDSVEGLAAPLAPAEAELADGLCRAGKLVKSRKVRQRESSLTLSDFETASFPNQKGESRIIGVEEIKYLIIEAKRAQLLAERDFPGQNEAAHKYYNPGWWRENGVFLGLFGPLVGVPTLCIAGMLCNLVPAPAAVEAAFGSMILGPIVGVLGSAGATKLTERILYQRGKEKIDSIKASINSYTNSLEEDSASWVREGIQLSVLDEKSRRVKDEYRNYYDDDLLSCLARWAS